MASARELSGVAAIGLWLVWRKGGALAEALRRHFERGRAVAAAPAYSGVVWSAPTLTLPSLEFRAAPPEARLQLQAAVMFMRPTPNCSRVLSPCATPP